MRLGVAAALLCLPATVLTPTPASPAVPAPVAVTLAAIPADSLVDSYGVGVHLPFLDTPYRDATAVAAALEDLGVRHVRDDLYLDNPRQYAGIKTLAEHGVRFDLITGNPATPGTPAQFVDAIADLPPGAVEAIEGRNEWDLFSRGATDWATSLADWQRQLYAAAKANPTTAHLPVLAPALAFRQNYGALSDLTPYADLANAHAYPGGYQPSNQLAQTAAAVRGVVADTKPIVTTEAGYHNAVNTSNGHLPVPEDVAGTYLPRLLLEHVAAGGKRVYSYELIDEFADSGLTNPEANFGLLRRDWTPKPAYLAMKNLLALARDPGPAFTPNALSVKVSGFPSDGKYVLTQKRSGQYVLFLWRDVAVYDPVTKKKVTVTPASVTVQLASPAVVKAYKPSQGATPVGAAITSQVPLSLDGQVVALTIDPTDPPPTTDPASPADEPAPTEAPTPAPAPGSVSVRSGNGSATVSWQPPSDDSAVTGYVVTRQPGDIERTVTPGQHSLRVSGLRNGTRYGFIVRALSAAGSSAASGPAHVVPATVPAPPRFWAKSPARRQLAVSWKAADPRGRAITSYEVTVGSKRRVVPATARRVVQTGLRRGAKVRVTVRARNAIGWGSAGRSWARPR
jgi:hypothetical protein